jgi:hypothetical protein
LFSSEYMEKLYRIYSWPENPFTKEGLERYEEQLRIFEDIVKHEWVRKVIETKGNSIIKITDYCGGYGIGGIGFAKMLSEKYGVNTRLTIIDLRGEALRIAEKFSKRELGYSAKIIVGNVLEKIKLREKQDFSLLWGYTTPHFSPWDLVRVLANISSNLDDHGLYIYDEIDRIHTIFYLRGYRDFLPEIVKEDKIVLTIHKMKDHITGYFKRLALELLSEKSIEMMTYFWDIAGSAALSWIFFEDIDFKPLDKPYRGVIYAWKPRRRIEPEVFLDRKPTMLLRNGSNI